ncbi:GntP family permease [Mycetocola spongiae]|uniref:GntP family permease n=1 Tax=Mycetocola spongiae TaxID=2859226 RepID=UPI001CF47E16|nr:GntP family permease [Mycetocola spongiae]UCR87977.1 GntP family permease [Mycetocola spongiae]
MTGEWSLLWELPTWGLLLVAAGSIALLLALIIWGRIHAFLALVIVSVLTAIATGIPTSQLVTVLTTGFGGTLGSVALLVGLGAMLGRMLETSGGAKVLTDALINKFGEKRAPLALSLASLMMGFPIFFDAGLVVMLPIIFTVARRLGGSLLTYAFPAATAFSVMHIFVPPHPGPVAATGLLGADVGLVLVFGLIVAIPTWYVVGHLFGGYVGRKYNIAIPDILFGAQNDESGDKFKSSPKLGTVLFLLLLPLGLIFLNTGLNALATAGVVSLEDGWVQVLRLLGETPIALLITVVLAMWLLGWRTGKPGSLVETIVDSALGPVCSIILITGAGGMFGGVLRESGIGGAIADSLDSLGLPLILAGFVIAAIVRIAQGSATVALTTAAALVQPVILTSGYNPVQLAAVVLALAAGSVFAGHVNDSGFWLVSRFFGMDTQTTLKTWTVGQALVAVVGFVIALAIFLVASA